MFARSASSTLRTITIVSAFTGDLSARIALALRSCVFVVCNWHFPEFVGVGFLEFPSTVEHSHLLFQAAIVRIQWERGAFQKPVDILNNKLHPLDVTNRRQLSLALQVFKDSFTEWQRIPRVFSVRSA